MDIAAGKVVELDVLRAVFDELFPGLRIVVEPVDQIGSGLGDVHVCVVPNASEFPMGLQVGARMIDGCDFEVWLTALARALSARLDTPVVSDGSRHADRAGSYWSLVWDGGDAWLADDCNTTFGDGDGGPIRRIALVPPERLPGPVDLAGWVKRRAVEPTAAPLVVCVDVSALLHRPGRPVTGPVWLAYGEHVFPAPRWDDFPIVFVVALAAAIESIQERATVEADASFLDGPFEVVLKRSGEGVDAVLRERRRVGGHDIVVPLNGPALLSFVDSVRRAAEALLAWADARAIVDSDVNALRSVVARLHRR